MVRLIPFGVLAWLVAEASLAAPAPAPPQSAERFVSYSGTATARRGGDFLYGERDVLHYRDNTLAERVVLYTCRNGTAFARKVIHYVDPIAPDFALEDASSGMREGLESRAGGRTVYFRANRSDTERSRVLPATRRLVADAGFDEFVRAEWTSLMSGRTVTLRFLVPSRLKDIGFDVQHLRSDHFQGVPVEVFRLDLAGFWGWFLPGIDVYYSASDHVLLHYDGLSDLRDASNANYQAEITFPLAERKPSDAPAFERMQSAPLARCP